jgi:hypothetical protein
LFGYPDAHEEDAERAVDAGLDVIPQATRCCEYAQTSGHPFRLRRAQPICPYGSVRTTRRLPRDRETSCRPL